MPGWLALPTLCRLLLPWTVTVVFHKALGDPGKTSAQPRIWGTVGERLRVWKRQLSDVHRERESLLSGRGTRGGGESGERGLDGHLGQ